MNLATLVPYFSFTKMVKGKKRAVLARRSKYTLAIMRAILAADGTTIDAFDVVITTPDVAESYLKAYKGAGWTPVSVANPVAQSMSGALGLRLAGLQAE